MSVHDAVDGSSTGTSVPSMWAPMNRGSVGARSLNIELQAALNPAGERKVERFGWTFAPGDRGRHSSLGECRSRQPLLSIGCLGRRRP
jgi:hypothetical protein